MGTRLLLICLLVCGLGVARAGATELGRPLLRVWTPEELDAHNEIRGIVQDARGLIYAGNREQGLEYDGVTWRKVPAPGITFARSLFYEAATDRVWIAGESDLGYLEPTPTGARRYVSLKPLLSPEERARIRGVAGVAAGPGGMIVAGDDSALYVYREGRLTRTPPPAGADGVPRLHPVGERLFITQRGVGLSEMTPEGPVERSRAPIFRAEGIYFFAAAPDGRGDFVLATLDAGLWRWAGGAPGTATDIAEPWRIPADATLRQGLTRGTLLPDGAMAFALLRAGVAVVEPDGRLRFHLDATRGLVVQVGYTVNTDRDGALWLGTAGGVARVEPGLAWTHFGPEDGLPRGTVRDIERFGGTLQLASPLSVHYLDAAAGRWRPRPGGTGSSFQIITTDLGEFSFDRGTLLWWPRGTPLDAPAQRPWVAPNDGICLAAARRDPARLWVGHGVGLSAARRTGDTWRDEVHVPGLALTVRSIHEDAAGTLWLGTQAEGVVRVDFADYTRPAAGAQVRFYGVAEGLPEKHDWLQVVPHGDTLLALTGRGIFAYDAATDRWRAWKTLSASWSDGSRAVGRWSSAGPRAAWVGGSLNLASPVPYAGRLEWDEAGHERWQPVPSAALVRAGRIETVLADPADPLIGWIGGTRGLVRVDARQASPPATPQALLRAVLTLADGVARPLGPATPERLPHAQGALRFEFAANVFAGGRPVEFATHLIGFESAPAAWSAATSREFTNLREGDYQFTVRARHDGHEGPPATFAFSVLPPWWRTWPAYAAYVFLLGGAGAGLVRWRTGALRRRAQILETIVAERTAELRANEEKLVAAREAAEAANKAKSAFLAGMSHELRTPLNGILGYTRLLLRDDAMAPTARERLRVVGDCGEHLLRLINEVLELAKVEAGKLELHAGPCELPRAVRTMVEVLRPRAVEKRLTLELVLAPDVPALVEADEQKLLQVLFNLTGNAVKFTARGGVVVRIGRADTSAADSNGDGREWSSRPAGEAGERVRLRFAVEDTGVGLSAAEQAQLFTPFAQVGHRVRAEPGTGLGLHISRRLVTLMGGELRVASEPGRGSCFSFELTLPLLAPTGRETGDRTAASVIGYAGPRRRVLLVDDHPVNLDVLRATLGGLGFDVATAGAGAAALALAAAEPPDLVLLDLRMQPMDGITLTRELRARPGGDRLHIAAISASAYDDEREQCLAAGCEAFLPKPCTEAALLETIGRLLGLTWVHGPAVSASVTMDGAPASSELGTVTPGPVPFPAEVLETLRPWADRGDVRRLREAVAAARLRRPDLSAELDALDGLAARFRLAEIRARLAALRTP